MDPTSVPNWSPQQLAEYLVRSLPEELRAPCKARIIGNGVTGAEVLAMIKERAMSVDLGHTPRPLKDHRTFKRIFDREWDGDGWRRWVTAVRSSEQACTRAIRTGSPFPPPLLPC